MIFECEMKDKNPINHVGLFEIICFIVVIVSFISILLLTIHKFNPYWALSLSTGVLIFLFIKYRGSFSIEKIWTKNNAALLLILFLALTFRYKPYLHTYGGIQDQGPYVLMSEMYAKTGSTFIHDDVRSKINDSILLQQYDSQDQLVIGEHSSWGIHLRDPNNGIYAFRFYPLHPLWMSIFSAVFGGENRVYSLLLFSLISISAFFLIVYELFDRKLAPAIIAGLIIAVNPFHAYLSKIPVSEIVCMAFVFSSLYFLLKCYKDAESNHMLKINNLYLFLSATLIGCLFFTRITAFVYLPFFYFLTIMSILYLPNNKIKKSFLVYFSCVFGLYALSILYGQHYTPRYVQDIIYKWVLPLVLGARWRIFLPAALIFITGFCFLLWFAVKKDLGFLNYGKEFLKKRKKYLLLITFLLTTALVGHITKRLDFISIHVLMEHVSIPLFLLIFPAAYFYSKKDIEHFSLLIILMLVYTASFQSEPDPNQFYPRYLVEPILFSLLLSLTFLLDMAAKRTRILKVICYATLISVFLYFAYYSSYQLKESPEIMHTAFTQIRQQMSDKDLLLIDRSGYNIYDFFAIKGSFDYFYRVHTFPVDRIETINDDKFFDYFKNYQNIFILSQKDKLQEVYINQTAVFKIELVSKIPYSLDLSVGINDDLPFKFSYYKGDFYLYQLKQ